VGGGEVVRKREHRRRKVNFKRESIYFDLNITVTNNPFYLSDRRFLGLYCRYARVRVRKRERELFFVGFRVKKRFRKK
jgi:hypothetical protein